MSRYLNEAVAEIDQLYEVVADAYRNDVLLYYSLKCFKLFYPKMKSLNTMRLMEEERNVVLVDQQTLLCLFGVEFY